ncbi:hypothetical protein BafPKo_J0035 (plasmid) [Borreliella afzelii PKo]|uniref:Uncharacterized protein n=1 Tax=Borreliella afzelii (strain PKo) TaxID=390236 RepID=G0IU12_BORAP|nr:hypothetical protein BafPKo_J0035 [Borreliella afzelii PKo]AJY73140.1 hypothetical protein BAFK78_J033 [Borreliella afzelii K78]
MLLGFEILIIVLSQVGHKCRRWGRKSSLTTLRELCSLEQDMLTL